MRRMRLGSQAIGHELAAAPQDENGFPVAPAGTQITEELMERLRAAGVEIIHVQDPAFADMAFELGVSAETLQMATTLFQETRSGIGQDPNMTLDYRSFARLVRAVERDVDDVSLDQALMLYPENEAQRDLVHALNRASLAIRMAMALDMRRYRFDLGLAGLIADAGMWLVPANILEKREHLDTSERAVIEGHVQDTLRLLSSEGGWSAMTRIAVTQHHERIDGSGYPKGLKGADIHRNGQILAVCDVYTAITLERPGRRLYTPAEALEFIVGGGATLFDFDLVSSFHRLVPPYPVGTEVELSSGEQAVIKEVHGPIKSRPIVRVFADAQGRRLSECYEIDLSDRRHHHLTIMGAVG